MSPPPRAPRPAAALVLLALLVAAGGEVILSKSSVEVCARDSGGGGPLSCDRKLVLQVAVASNSSGGDDLLVVSDVAVGAEGNGTRPIRQIREPPVITISKSAVYVLYDLIYETMFGARFLGAFPNSQLASQNGVLSPLPTLKWRGRPRDVAYRPEEHFVDTRKCEPDAGADVVQSCERLHDQTGNIIAHTEPVCCPCGPHRRASTSCGSVFGNMFKGKANTAHCVRFTGDWFHEVVVSPENRTVISGDGFLRVNIVGDFNDYKSIPSFEDVYLVTPRKGAGDGPPQDPGDEYSRWMLLDKFRFSLNHLECDKIGVSYEAFQRQPNFCSSPFSSCLYNQLWNFWEDDQNRIKEGQEPEHVVVLKYQRINQHPNASGTSFSLGVTDVHNTNLMVELRADDIKYVYQRSPGKIISINCSSFEALSEVGTANVTTKNIGELEALYGLTFNCESGINDVEEQNFIMKSDEVVVRSFSLHSSSDVAANYQCTAILKASNFSELDRKECQISINATVFDNGTQIGYPKKGGISVFFDAVKAFCANVRDNVIDFFTGKSCRTRCSGLFDFSCHLQYKCIKWLVQLGLLLSMLVAVVVLLRLLHAKGFFGPFLDWFGLKGRAHPGHRRGHHHRHHRLHGDHDHVHHEHRRRRSDEPHHHHHRVLHRHGGPPQPDVEPEGSFQRHDPALGVLRRDVIKHRHGKAAAAAAALHSWDGASMEEDDDAGEHRERRRQERQHDWERHNRRSE
ncbi:hypothetical protein ACP4OV_024180 [Aristida adscensionis]